MKKVSIIIPVYNGSNYVGEAIDSALAQTYKNKEIIVVNDGSNDKGATRDIVLSYGDKVKYYEKENGGVSTALNLGIEKMTGDYFSWLSHDDIYYPNKLERQMEEIKKYNDNTILFSNVDMIDLDGKVFDTFLFDHELLNKKPDYALFRGMISGITLLIPKKAFEEFGLFNEKYRCVQDYLKWFEFTEKYNFVHIEDVLAASRVHPKQVTLTSPKMIMEGNWLWAYMAEKYPEKKKIEYEGSEYAFYQEMEIYLKSSPYREAEKKMHLLKEECVKKAKHQKKKPTITVVVIENESDMAKQKTLDSLNNQTMKDFIIIEDKINNINNTLKKIKTDYYTFLNAGTTAKENWLETQQIIASISNKSVIISDYKRSLRTGSIDNYCTFLVPLDGIFFQNIGGIKYEYTYQYILENALINGSMTTEDSFLENIKENYNMKEVFGYLTKILEKKKYSDYQLATLNYDISVIYNHNSTDGKKVFMYEDSDEYRELKYSRSFRLYQKYFNYKKKRKKTI